MAEEKGWWEAEDRPKAESGPESAEWVDGATILKEMATRPRTLEEKRTLEEFGYNPEPKDSPEGMVLSWMAQVVIFALFMVLIAFF